MYTQSRFQYYKPQKLVGVLDEFAFNNSLNPLGITVHTHILLLFQELVGVLDLV